MSRPRPLIVAASVALAILAGIWAGGAVSPSPPRDIDRSALARFDAARVHARAQLNAATSPQAQRDSARELARVYREAARALPQQQGPLHDAADVYEALASASGRAAFATAARRAVRADSTLAAALGRPSGAPADPVIPPALPLVMLAAGAAGAAVSSRRRKPTRPPPPDPPPPPRPAWDTPPFGI